MPKYRVVFTEVTTYTVEFDSKNQLDENGDYADGSEPKGLDSAWFDEMDRTAPNWFSTDCETIEVSERELDSIEDMA